MNEGFRDVSNGVPAEVVEELRAIQVPMGHGRERSAWELLAGWAYHVDRFVTEKDLTGEGARHAWNAHDYVAALIVRDLLDRGMRSLDGAAAEHAERIAGEVDETLTTFTEEDRAGVLNRFAAEDVGPGWWWSRTPASGPVAVELRTFAERTAGESGGSGE